MLDKVGYGLHRGFFGPPLKNEPVIKILYPRRFGRGKCILGALVPINKRSDPVILRVMKAQRECDYPSIITSGGGGRYLRIVHRLPDVRSDDQERISKCIKMFAGWASQLFDMRTVLFPIDGFIEAKQRLRMF